MSIWDTITGRKSQPSTTAPPTADRDIAPHDTFTSQPFDTSISSAGAAADYLLDPASLNPLAGLGKDTLEYLQLEDSVLSDLPGGRSALPSRGWSDDLCYGTGVTYLAALSIGGAWGLAEGLSRTPVTAPAKIRLNAVLNSVTRRGPFLGNSAGVIALTYNGINSYIGYMRGKHDAFNSIAAGGLSGMIFKSTRGPRQMLISGGLVASVAGLWTAARHTLI